MKLTDHKAPFFVQAEDVSELLDEVLTRIPGRFQLSDIRQAIQEMLDEMIAAEKLDDVQYLSGVADRLYDFVGEYSGKINARPFLVRGFEVEGQDIYGPNLPASF